MANKKEKDSIEVLIASLKKKYGENSIFKISELRPIPRVSSGSLRVDVAIGGGIPVGRITEVYGEESSGKTWFCLLVAKSFSDSGIPVFWVDKEGTLDENLVNNFFKIDPDMFRIINTKSAENDLQATTDILMSKITCLIVIDSIPALIPSQEVDNGMGKASVSGNAGLISKAMRIFQNALNMNDRNEKPVDESKAETEITGDEVEGLEATILMINQVRDNVGSYIGGIKTPGGRALKHFASLRLWARRIEWIEVEGSSKDAKVKVGQIVGIRVMKNKTAPPFRDATFTINFPPKDAALDVVEELVNIAVEKQIIVRGGSWMSFNGKSVAQGLDKTIEAFKENPELLANLKEQLKPIVKVKI